MDGNYYLHEPEGQQPAYQPDMYELYPDITKRINPYVEDVVEAFAGGPVTAPEVDRLAAEAVRGSGVMDDPPHGHNSNTVADIAKTLVLAALLDRHGYYNDYYPYYPYPYPPFYIFPFHGRRDFRGGHRGRGRY